MSSIYDFKKGDYVIEAHKNHGIIAMVVSVDTIFQTVTVKYHAGSTCKTTTLHYSRLEKTVIRADYEMPFNREM